SMARIVSPLPRLRSLPRPTRASRRRLHRPSLPTVAESLALPVAPAHCAGCDTQLAATLLACPACGQLVYAARLKELAAAASERTKLGELAEALACWREALELLPPETRQHAQIVDRIAELGKQVAESPAPATAKSPWKKLGGGA